MHIYPYDTWDTVHLVAMAVRIFYTWSADLPQRHYRLPPLLGGLWYIKPPRHYYQQRLDTSLSFANYDLLDEHI